MKIKNNSDQPFSYEETQIAPNEIKEVKDDIGQRLLVLYWNKPLVLIEDEKMTMSKTNTGIPEITGTTSTKSEPVNEENKFKITSMLKKAKEVK